MLMVQTQMVLQVQEHHLTVMTQLLHTVQNGLAEDGTTQTELKPTKEHLAGNVTQPDGGLKILQAGIQQASGRR